MKYAIIFAAFAISWGLMVQAHASDGYFVGLVLGAIVAGMFAANDDGDD
jgi:multisubunit Na+/H+ antiporter MnhE subunit